MDWLFSLQMVLMWTCGDVFKTTYFYVRKTPPQFVICGLLQVMVDIAILTQVWIYYENTAKRKKTQMSMHFWQQDDDDEDDDLDTALLSTTDERDSNWDYSKAFPPSFYLYM